jgi:hypothetical protein
MFTTIEVTIDKTGHLHTVESGQTIKPGRSLLTWLEPDTTHEPALMAEAALAHTRGGCGVGKFAAGQIIVLPVR